MRCEHVGVVLRPHGPAEKAMEGPGREPHSRHGMANSQVELGKAKAEAEHDEAEYCTRDRTPPFSSVVVVAPLFSASRVCFTDVVYSRARSSIYLI